MKNKIQGLSLILTRLCNLKCKYCYYNSDYYNNVSQNYLNIKKFEEFISKNNIDTDVIYLTGGEPLLHSSIKEFINISKSISKKVTLLTNGTLFTDDMMNFLMDNNITLNISVDSLDKIYQNTIRGEADRVFDVLDKLYRNNYKNVVLTPTVTSKNINMIEQIYDFCIKRQWGIEISFVEIDNNNELSLKNVDIKELKNIIELIAKLRSSNATEQFTNKIFIESLLDSLISNKENILLKNCSVAENNLTIDTDGKIYICYHNKKTIGTLENSYCEIMQSKSKYLDNRESFDCLKLGCL